MPANTAVAAKLEIVLTHIDDVRVMNDRGVLVMIVPTHRYITLLVHQLDQDPRAKLITTK